MSFFVNIDLPTSEATIHRSTCSKAQRRQKATRNGGWHEFGSFAAARQFADQSGQRTVIECSYCEPQLP